MNATQVAQLGIVNDHKQVFPAFTSLTITIRDLGTLLLADGEDPLALAGIYHRDMTGLGVELRLVMLYCEPQDSIRKPIPVSRRY